mgnify:FL=1|jgi:hypothetical protein
MMDENKHSFSLNDVVIILHEDGDTSFIFNEETKLNPDQMELFIRFYMCVKPSLMLRVFLILEGFLTTLTSSVKSAIHKK